MTESSARFLVSSEGTELLQKGAVVLAKQRGLDPELRAAALAVLEGRARAQRKGIPEADRLFLTPEMLAQASSPRIAAWHAAQLAPFGRVLDCCCGAGLDTLAFAQAGLRVTAIELDPARAHFARANCALSGFSEQVTVQIGDCTELNGEVEAAFFDPARRDGSQRVSRHGERYCPPLSFLATLTGRAKATLAKLSPALPDEELVALGGQVIFLSEDRTCKEACVAFGFGEGPPSALLLPSEERFVSGGEMPMANGVGTYLLDPDPALLRAGALASLGLARITETDSYLTSETPVLSPAVRCYRVLTALPYRDRTLGRWLRDQEIGRLVVKKRHYPKEPEAVHRELGLKGKGTEATLVIIAQGKSWLGVVCEPVVDS